MKRILILLLTVAIVFHIGTLNGIAQEDVFNLVDKLSLEELKRLETYVKDKISKASKESNTTDSKDTGMWKIGYYVDKFGDITDKAYVSNKSLISGTFNNSATQNSPLYVRLLVNPDDRISIILFTYSTDNRETFSSSDRFTVHVKDSDGKTLKISAIGSSDRLRIEAKDAQPLHNLLRQNTKLKFHISNDRRSINSYNFEIQDSSFYSTAYAQMAAKGVGVWRIAASDDSTDSLQISNSEPLEGYYRNSKVERGELHGSITIKANGEAHIELFDLDTDNPISSITREAEFNLEVVSPTETINLPVSRTLSHFIVSSSDAQPLHALLVQEVETNKFMRFKLTNKDNNDDDEAYWILIHDCTDFVKAFTTFTHMVGLEINE